MVTVRLFARLKDLAKREALTLSVNQPVSLKQFIETLSPSLPEVMPLVKAKRVLIAVGAEHRAEAFRAYQWCIDPLKAITPIWKKEVTPKGEVWVEEHP